MENGQKKLKELFDGRKVFNIPDYQRAYSWDDSKQLPDFIEDIDNQSIDRDYFFGTVLFQHSNAKFNGFDVIDIVDGQQRITTIIIFMKVLLKCLRSLMSDEDYTKASLDLLEETYLTNRGRPKLQALAPDNDFFQTYIIGDVDGARFIETPSQRRLLRAKTFFEQNLSKRSRTNLIELKTKLDESTKVLTYSVKDAAEATLIFETTNDRGKNLTNLEKIKSFLMYKTYLAAGEDTDRYLSVTQQRFSEIFRELELFEGRLDEDAVLLYHCIAFEQWIAKEDYQQPVRFIKSILNPKIASHQKGDALAFIERFALELKQTFRTLREILNGDFLGFQDLVYLERLGNFYPLIIKCFKADKSKEKKQFERICRLLEIFSFRVFALQQSRSNAGQSQLYTLARDFNGRFDPLADKLSDLILRYSPKKQFKDNLTHIELYNWIGGRDLCYLFWKYENHLRGSEQPVCSSMSYSELKATDRRTKLSVEHIASQHPNSIIKDGSIIDPLDDDFLENHIHRLGNLTFDPSSANSSKSNSVFLSKNVRYFNKAPFKTQNELESFIDRGKWSRSSIDKREKKVVDFCLKAWNPEYVDD